MFQELKARLSERNQSCAIYQKNKQLLVFKLPKNIFITQILPFLDEEELITLSQSCKIFNALIYNTYTLQFLLSNNYPSKYGHINIINPQHSNQPQLEEKKFEVSDADDDYIMQLETLRHLNDFMGHKALTLQTVTKNNAKEIAQLKGELQVARERNMKNIKKILSLENQINESEVVKQDHGETIEELKKNYENILEDKEKRMVRLREQNKTLEEDKARISKELVKINQAIESLNLESEKYKEALASVKKFIYSSPNEEKEADKLKTVQS